MLLVVAEGCVEARRWKTCASQIAATVVEHVGKHAKWKAGGRHSMLLSAAGLEHVEKDANRAS